MLINSDRWAVVHENDLSSGSRTVEPSLNVFINVVDELRIRKFIITRTGCMPEVFLRTVDDEQAGC